MSDQRYSTRTTRTVYYSDSSSSDGRQQSNVSQTVSYTDRDGRVHTQTTNYPGGRSADDFLDFNPNRHLNINQNRPQPVPQEPPQASIGQRLKTAMESGARRYSSGWGNRNKSSRHAPVKAMSVQGKSFAEIKKECLARGVLFEDPDFPAVDSSIFYSQRPPRPFAWKRPPVTSRSHPF